MRIRAAKSFAIIIVSIIATLSLSCGGTKSIEIAKIHMMYDKYEKAEEALIAGMEKEPYNPEIPFFLGTQIYYRQNNYIKMQEMFDRTKSIKPPSAKGFFIWGEFFYNIDDYYQMLNCFKESLSISNEYSRKIENHLGYGFTTTKELYLYNEKQLSMDQVSILFVDINKLNLELVDSTYISASDTSLKIYLPPGEHLLVSPEKVWPLDRMADRITYRRYPRAYYSFKTEAGLKYSIIDEKLEPKFGLPPNDYVRIINILDLKNEIVKPIFSH